MGHVNIVNIWIFAYSNIRTTQYSRYRDIRISGWCNIHNAAILGHTTILHATVYHLEHWNIKMSQLIHKCLDIGMLECGRFEGGANYHSKPPCLKGIRQNLWKTIGFGGGVDLITGTGLATHWYHAGGCQNDSFGCSMPSQYPHIPTSKHMQWHFPILYNSKWCNIPSLQYTNIVNIPI